MGWPGINSEGKRMLRKKVQSIYNRQTARCLADICELWEIPKLVEDRIKKAIEFACKDVDRLNNQNNTKEPYGTEEDTNYNR